MNKCNYDDMKKLVDEYFANKPKPKDIKVKCICELHNIEVEQYLECHGPGVAAFSYSCGCTSKHTKTEDIWESKSGLVIKKEKDA